MSIKDLLYRAYEHRLAKQLTKTQIPQHIGVILDGNRRWARSVGLSAAHGHSKGADKVFELLSWCNEVGVQVVTLWVLSTDNLRRPSTELSNLLEIICRLVEDIAADKRWRLRLVGNLEILAAADALTAKRLHEAVCSQQYSSFACDAGVDVDTSADISSGSSADVSAGASCNAGANANASSNASVNANAGSNASVNASAAKISSKRPAKGGSKTDSAFANTTESLLQVNVAVGYGGREEIVDAVRAELHQSAAEGKSLLEVAQSFTAANIESHLYTAGQPDPDLVIRTSGEQRLSGFLIWQSVHTEYFFCETFWPEFRRTDFLRALRDYANRERRLGA